MKEKFCATKCMNKLQPLRDKRNHIILQPQKAALLVIDMQRFFLEETSHAFVPNMPTIVSKIKRLQECFLVKHLPVIQTKQGNTKENAKAMGRWWGDHILETNDPLANVISELVNEKIPIMLKTQYDAFWETDLEQRLKDHGIEQVVITGVMTHLCCETTARAAFVRGFDVFFTVDGTASYNRDFHCGSLLNLAHGFVVPMLCQEVMDIINEN